MRKLKKPSDNAGTVYSTCISIVRNSNLKSRLQLIEDEIVDASNEYDKLGAKDLYLFPSNVSAIGSVTVDELRKVYKLRLAKKGRPARKYYDKLISAPINDICPLCAQRHVSTLDHYLPQANYPILSVVLYNLVPSCLDCNKIKLNRIPTRSEETTMHPYYDNVEDEQWLFANVFENPPFFRFFVNCPKKWDSVLQKRLEYHFGVFSLNNLYIIHATEELTNIRPLA